MLSVLKFGGKKSPPSDESSAGISETRRAQLRLAQRRHRNRKQAYLEALRKEVAELRRHCHSTLHRNENLKRYIKQHTNLGDDAIEAICRANKNSDAATPGADQSLAKSPNFNVSPSGQVYIFQRDTSDAGMPFQLRHSSPVWSEQLEYQLAVNWILGLERVCLEHIHVVADPNGSHSHQVTSQLINATAFDITANRPASISDHDVSLSNLLNLSSAFALEEEITPVQAWFILKEQGRCAGAGADRLLALSKLLLRSVKCHEFGAVIDRAVFARHISQVFDH